MPIVLTIMILFAGPLKAPDSKSIAILEATPIRPYEGLSKAIDIVETNCDPFAIGDRNLKEWSYGIKQIRQIKLDDYFRLTGIRYEVTDMFDPVKADEVFIYFAHKIGPYDFERIARVWNGGSGKGMKLASTKTYYLKVQKVLLSLELDSQE